MLKRALGYSYDEVTRERVLDYDPSTGQVVGSHMEITKTVKKEVQGDTTAQIFWLKNRKPEQWRDKPQSESASDKALAKAIEILGGVNSAID
mgnify:CR=1 FL=1